jgi:hypothetical protein
MAFIRVEGLSGKVFVPDGSPEPKKHPCPDCVGCQHCSDDRCRVCRGACVEDGTTCERCCDEDRSCGKGFKGSSNRV